MYFDIGSSGPSKVIFLTKIWCFLNTLSDDTLSFDVREWRERQIFVRNQFWRSRWPYISKCTGPFLALLLGYKTCFVWWTIFRPMTIAMAFFSLYWLSFFFPFSFSSFIRTPMNYREVCKHIPPASWLLAACQSLLARLLNALQPKFQLQLLSPIGHICFSRCKWYI